MKNKKRKYIALLIICIIIILPLIMLVTFISKDFFYYYLPDNKGAFISIKTYKDELSTFDSIMDMSKINDYSVWCNRNFNGEYLYVMFRNKRKYYGLIVFQNGQCVKVIDRRNNPLNVEEKGEILRKLRISEEIKFKWILWKFGLESEKIDIDNIITPLFGENIEHTASKGGNYYIAAESRNDGKIIHSLYSINSKEPVICLEDEFELENISELLLFETSEGLLMFIQPDWEEYFMYRIKINDKEKAKIEKYGELDPPTDFFDPSFGIIDVDYNGEYAVCAQYWMHFWVQTYVLNIKNGKGEKEFCPGTTLYQKKPLKKIGGDSSDNLQ